MTGPLILACLMPFAIVAVSYACRRKRGYGTSEPAPPAEAERAPRPDAEPQPRETVAFDRGAYAIGESGNIRVPAKGGST